MQLDITINKGSGQKPVVIFIHGLGVDKGFWTDPGNSRVLGGSILMKVFAARKPRPCSIKPERKLSVGKLPEKPENLWTDAVKMGFNTVCWTQKRPAGPIGIAVREFEYILKYVTEVFPGKPIAIIGHSRGGLVARKLMEKNVPEIKALITVATPHKGSSLSRLGNYLAPLAPVIKKLLPKDSHSTASELIKRTYDLLENNALKELLPDSAFFKTLKDLPRDNVKYLSFGGTVTKLITVYKWKKENDKFYPKPLLTIPDSLLKILPSGIIPDEITPGKGDFMVTAESAVLPWAQKHYNLPANHISIASHKKMKDRTLKLIEEL
ncbi:MAG TPA: hypothetical protein ENH45_03605 [Nitrospirae bacterium]|nr:PGAP1-like protein [bacterium BMS3Abin09]HDH34614.1 hypothetical protein [Nitrospirota bacterium]HDZ84283.1 hypothetical protein [Nitrospirota bacterium]